MMHSLLTSAIVPIPRAYEFAYNDLKLVYRLARSLTVTASTSIDYQN